MDFAEPGNGDDEGWFQFAAEAAHFGEGEFESGGHVLAGHVAGSEDEFADGVLFERLFFEEVVADAFVSRQQDPALRAHAWQPSFVGNSSIEMSKMALEANAELGQGV